jgi:hypothetical protein
VLLALWEIVATARAGHDVPSDDDWQAARAWVDGQRSSTDLMLIAPRWLDPVGRMHLGDWISLDQATRMDSGPYSVLWEFSARGASAPETAGLEVATEKAFGDLTVRRYEKPAAAVVSDFVTLFSRERVKGEVDRPRIVGVSTDGASVAIEEVGFEPHRCVRIIPKPGKTVDVTYENVELGTTLVGYVGLADIFTRRDIREPGRLEVFVGGESAAIVEPGVDDGWVRFEAATESGTGSVRFSVSAAVPKRLVCFAAEARR